MPIVCSARREECKGTPHDDAAAPANVCHQIVAAQSRLTRDRPDGTMSPRLLLWGAQPSGDCMSQTILVTGASSGIGQPTARLLAARGFTVFGTARKPDSAK